MPARSERIYLYPDNLDEPGTVIPFPVWWDRRAFFDAYGSREVDTGNPFYVNYGLLLTPGEAMTWDDRCRTAFAADERSRLPIVIEQMRVLKETLPRTRWVVVESYEWESGLD
jgi:hypothetical protein